MNQVSYCAVHNTYPEAGEPCWACANPFIQKAYEEGLQAAQQSVHSDAGDSAASSNISNASAESTSKTETQPAQRG